MPKSEPLTVDEALHLADMTERNLDAFEATAPETVRSLGGRDALARMSQATCIGPMPRLDAATWERMSREYEDRRQHGDLTERERRLAHRG